MSTSKPSDEYGTPDWVYRAACVLFGPHVLDAASSGVNSKCRDCYTILENGLHRNWWGNVWCNPPYSNPRPWAEKAVNEVAKGEGGCTVTMLLPADTSTRMFHLLARHAHIYLLDQRIKFVGATQGAKFGSMFCRLAPPTLDKGGIWPCTIRYFYENSK